MHKPVGDASKRLDRPTFSLAVLAVALVSIPFILMADTIGPTIIAVYDWAAFNFTILFQWTTIAAMLFLGYLAFGRYGGILLGDAGDTPDFSTLSWVAMLFSAGVGGALLYWASIEWSYYMVNPPFGAVPKSVEAINWATAYGLFHWGVAAWCIYALPTVAISYSFYVRKIPYLRLSAAILGEKAQSSWLARLIDLCFMLGLIGGAGTALSLTVPMVSAAFSAMTGMARSTVMDIAVIAVCVALFGVTVYLGLEKGIKKLADANLAMSIVLLVFVLVAGPTGFILMMGTQSIGFMVSHFVDMLTWTDPIQKTGFVQDWTIFYWAWWTAFAPFVGIFVTRISRGRTIRQVILSMCLFGSLGAWSFYIVLGNYALSLELGGRLPVSDIVTGDAFATIVSVLQSLPFGRVVLGIFMVVTVIFVATTYNSASYTLASAATQELHAGEDPAQWHRLFWAVVLGLIPIGLMYVGGLKVVQSATLLAGVPIAVASLFMMRTLLKWLKEDER